MTESVTWVKWHFNKWRADPGLRMVSLAARGLWADLLAVMHECEPYGHLVINGRVPSTKQIASIVGMTSEREVATCLEELRTNGVFSVTEEGMIFSRRLKRDREAREAGQFYGAQGGNPSLTKKSKRLRKGGGITPPPKTESEEESEKEKSPSLRSGAAPNARDELWAVGPAVIQALTGKHGQACKSFLGKILKLARDDCSLVLSILQRAEQLRPVDATSWLVKAAGAERRNSEDRIQHDWNLPSVGQAALDAEEDDQG